MTIVADVDAVLTAHGITPELDDYALVELETLATATTGTARWRSSGVHGDARDAGIGPHAGQHGQTAVTDDAGHRSTVAERARLA